VRFGFASSLVSLLLAGAYALAVLPMSSYGTAAADSGLEDGRWLLRAKVFDSAERPVTAPCAMAFITAAGRVSDTWVSSTGRSERWVAGDGYLFVQTHGFAPWLSSIQRRPSGAIRDVPAQLSIGARFEGRVLGPTGAPVTGVQVTSALRLPVGKDGIPVPGAGSAIRVKTDESGRFTLEQLSGEYHLIISPSMPSRLLSIGAEIRAGDRPRVFVLVEGVVVNLRVVRESDREGYRADPVFVRSVDEEAPPVCATLEWCEAERVWVGAIALIAGSTRQIEVVCTGYAPLLVDLRVEDEPSTREIVLRR
jgi:hypothetical protein